MASVATSNITNITRLISGSKGNALNMSSLPVQVFRIAAGQAPGDTAVLTPIAGVMPNIQSVWGAPHNLPASGASTVTVTVGTIGASGTTVPAFDVVLVGPLPGAGAPTT